MRYLGGKERLAKQLAEVMLDGPQRDCYFEPFVGGASVLKKMAPHFVQAAATDVVPDLIALYQAIQRGWVPPTIITEDCWRMLRDAEPSPERALAGFGGSFGGKWFAGYARGAGRNYVAETGRNLLAMRQAIAHVRFKVASYEWARADGRYLIYCDPPYADTTTYGATEPFDTNTFWNWCRVQAERGALVYVSEYQAPRWARLVFERQVKSTVMKDKVDNDRTERLWLVG